MENSSKPHISRVVDFHRLLLDFRAVKRVTRIPGTEERENDVDHSYTLAMTGWYLSGFFPQLDRDKIIRKCLAHDFTEVHANDTFAFGEDDHLASKAEREQQSLGKLAVDWPDFPELIETIHEYEARLTPEDNFVYALDKVMPIIISIIGGGRDFQDYNISLERMHEQKKDKVSASPEIEAYYYELLDMLGEMPHLFTGSDTGGLQPQ